MTSCLADRFAGPLLTLAFVILLTAASADAQAAAKRGSRKAKSMESYAGSAETTRERERRLARECRGRPNAGACLGFGQ